MQQPAFGAVPVYSCLDPLDPITLRRTCLRALRIATTSDPNAIDPREVVHERFNAAPVDPEFSFLNHHVATDPATVQWRMLLKT